MDLFVYLLAFTIFVISCCFESRDRFRYYGKYMVYAVWSTLVAIVLMPWFAVDEPGHVKHSRRTSVILRQSTKVLGIKWELRGAENVRDLSACVVVVNHQSVLDILGLFNIWTSLGNLAPVAKKAVRWIIPFGLIAILAGVVFIDRKDAKGSLKTMTNVVNKGKNDAIKLLIFPEGTRNKDVFKNGLQPFKRGAFKIAIDHQLPILPIVFSPYYFIDDKTYFFGHGRIIAKVLEPIPTLGLGPDDIDKLMDETHSIMLKEIESLTTEVLSTLPENYPGAVRWSAKSSTNGVAN